MTIFANCVFFIKVKYLPIQKRNSLKACITENGGVINFVLNNKVSSRFISEISEGKYQMLKVLWSSSYREIFLCSIFHWKYSAYASNSSISIVLKCLFKNK